MRTVAGMMLLILTNPSFGQTSEKWSYERLLKEADLVVVATSKGTIDSDDRLQIKESKKHLVGQETFFTVNAALKGTVKDQKRLIVLHYATAAGASLINGPSLVRFRKEGRFFPGPEIRGALSRPEYMLFLRALPDGRYEPVSGQMNPALSIREVYGFEDMFQFADDDEKARK